MERGWGEGLKAPKINGGHLASLKCGAKMTFLEILPPPPLHPPTPSNYFSINSLLYCICNVLSTLHLTRPPKTDKRLWNHLLMAPPHGVGMREAECGVGEARDALSNYQCYWHWGV